MTNLVVPPYRDCNAWIIVILGWADLGSEFTVHKQNHQPLDLLKITYK